MKCLVEENRVALYLFIFNVCCTGCYEGIHSLIVINLKIGTGIHEFVMVHLKYIMELQER